MRGIRISGLKLGVLAMAILAVGTFVSPASAGVVGHLSLTNCASGGVIVSATKIDWFLPTNTLNLGTGCIQTGGVPTLTGLGAVPVLGTINDLDNVTPGANIGFMKFGAYVFDLAIPGLGPGLLNDCTVDPGVGNSCSVPSSPFILTETISQTGVTGTSVTLAAQGTIAGSVWSGAFTTQINGQSPSQIQTALVSGAISSSYSGEFDVTAVPEPISMLLIGTGLIVFALIRRHKKARA